MAFGFPQSIEDNIQATVWCDRIALLASNFIDFRQPKGFRSTQFLRLLEIQLSDVARSNDIRVFLYVLCDSCVALRRSSLNFGNSLKTISIGFQTR